MTICQLRVTCTVQNSFFNMKSILLCLSAFVLSVESASILPLEHASSSSVNVKQNGNEFSYTIQEKKGLGLEPLQPLPVVPIIETILNGQPQKHVLINDLKRKDESQDQDKLPDQDQLKIQNLLPMLEKLQKPNQDQIKLQEIKPIEMKLEELPQLQLKKEQMLEQKVGKTLEDYQIIPGYRLVPADNVLIEYPYFYPYLNGYAYHYPHLRLY